MKARTPAGGAHQAAAVKTERHSRHLIATLWRPPGNRINAALSAELMALFEEFEDDDATMLLALRGAGDCFCGGFDPGVDQSLVESLAALSKPTLAILNGDALDEGLELAMAADLRIALSGARLGLTQAVRGEMPRFGGTQRLPRLIGAAQALQMMLSGGSIEARRGEQLGLVGYLADDAEALERIVQQVIGGIERLGPIAVRLAKEAVLKGFDLTLDQGIRLEEDLYALLQTTSDRAEGVKAFLAKRKPLFKGK